MSAKTFLLFVGKIVVCSLAFVLGLMGGGMMATALHLQAPQLPPEIDINSVTTLMLATSPLLILALYGVNRELAGGWPARSAMLFLLSWITYSVNNVIEAAVFTSYESASWFTVVNFIPALLLAAVTTAWLFPSPHSHKSFGAAWHEFFQQHPPNEWGWRLAMAALVFMPIYYLFGLMVVPFVGDYYQQGASGLTVPPLATLLLVLFVRSLLFLVACLPVIVAWQGRRLELFLSLGLALFVLVGLLYMLAGTWIAPHIRLAHSLEILADSLVYAGALVLLLTRPQPRPTTPLLTPL